MARKESDLVKNDAWAIDGLISNAHVMGDWAERRLKGVLTAELTEAVRQEVGSDVLGLDMSESESRKTVATYLKDEANTSTVDAIRTRLRGEAQAAFEAGEYGKGTRGPLQDPPRVKAILPFITELYAKHGVEVPDGREAHISLVAQFEAKFGGERGKYRAKIAELTAHLAKPTVELVADL